MDWIGIKEKKPPYKEYILVTNGDIVWETKLRGADFLESERFGMSPNEYTDDITHWMPLPAPPKEECSTLKIMRRLGVAGV